MRVLRGTQIPREIRGLDERIGKIYDLKPDGLRFLKPVTIIRRLAGFDLSAGLPGIWLVTRSARGKWAFAGTPTIEIQEGRLVVRGKILHFSDVATIDGGVRVKLVPARVAKNVGEIFRARIDVLEGDIYSGLIGTDWRRSGAVDYAYPSGPGGEVFATDFKCASEGPGTYGAIVRVRDVSAPAEFLSHLMRAGVHFKGEVDGHAVCRAAPPACAEPPKVAPTTYNGEAHVQLVAQCFNMLAAGMVDVRLQAPDGTEIYGYAAHSTACDLNTLFVVCKVKPDGRICMIVKFNLPTPAGTLVPIQLRRADGSILFEQTLTIGANGEATCSIGP